MSYAIEKGEAMWLAELDTAYTGGNDGFTPDQIMRYTDLTAEQINNLTSSPGRQIKKKPIEFM